MELDDFRFAIGLPPEKAIEYLSSKGYAVGFHWHEIWQEAHTKAFTVAGILKQDILTDIHQSLIEAQKTGIPQQQWEKNIGKVLYDKGWLGAEAQLLGDENGELMGKRLTPHRLNTIYQTNMRIAERVGEYQAMKEVAHLRPYWRYVAMYDARPSHAALHNSVYPVDDPFWDTFYPPNGWNCRCKVFAVKERDLKENADWQLRKTTEEDYEQYVQNIGGIDRIMTAYKLPDGRLFRTDAGFNYNPGKSYLANLGQTMLEKGVNAPPRVAAVAINETFKNAKLMTAFKNDFKNIVQEVKKTLDSGKSTPQNKLFYVGAILPQVLNVLENENVILKSSVISITDNVLYHAYRDSKAQRKQGDKRLPIEFWENLPEMLLKPKAVLRDKTSRNPNIRESTILYLFDNPNGKAVIRLNYKENGVDTNSIRSGEKILDITTLQDKNKFDLLYGEID